MFRIVWVAATNDMDGLQPVGDRLCDICDFGRIHLTTTIFGHELSPTQTRTHSNPCLYIKYSFQHFNLLISSHIIPSPDKPFPLIEFLVVQDFATQWTRPIFIFDSSPFLLDNWTHDVFNVMSQYH